MLVGCLLLTGCPRNQSGQAKTPAKLDEDSILRFATDDFFGGAYVDLESLSKNKTYQTLPLDLLSHTDIFLDRFDTSVVSEFALFVGANKDEARRDLGYELAATAKLKPSTDLKTVFDTWQATANMPKSFVDTRIEPVEVAGKACFRCPTGTFLNSRNSNGVLRWYGRDGKPRRQGISIGSFAPRNYIAGDSKSKVVITFEVSKADIAAGKLELLIKPRVFRTRRAEIGESQLAIVHLQRPAETPDGTAPGKVVRGKAVSVEVTSFVEHTVTLDASTRESKIADLTQFVRDGKVEVVLQSNNEGNYLGLAVADIELVKDEFEFVWIDGTDFVVAQSMTRLADMISSAKAGTSSSLALALAKNDNQQASIFAKHGSSAELKSWIRLLRNLNVLTDVSVLPNSPHQVSGSVTMNKSTLATVDFKMNEAKDAKATQGEVREWLTNGRAVVVQELIDFSRRYEMMATLSSMAMGDGKKLVLSGEGIDRPIQELATKSTVEDLFNSVSVAGASSGEFTVSFAKPEWLSGMKKHRFHAVQLIKLERASECHRLEKYPLHARLLRKTISEMPEEKALWMRASHQLSFNVSMDAGNDLSRYQWVRKGILLSLDGYESDPESVDLLCNAAFFLGNKIGASDQRLVFRKLFVEDAEFHKRLAPYLDIELAKTPDGKVDNWLAADQLIEFCQKAMAEGKTQEVSEYRLETYPATILFRIAQSLDEEGCFDGRLDRWRDAEERLETLVASRLPDKKNPNETASDPRELIRMPTVESVRKTLYGRQENDLIVAKLQQLDWVQLVHQTTFSAYQAEVDGEHEAALEKYQDAMDGLIKQVKQFPIELEPMQRQLKVTPAKLYADTFSRMIERYKIVLRHLKMEMPEKHSAFLK